VEDVEQAAQHLHPVGRRLLTDLIAGAPENDGRMVPIAPDHISGIAAGPFLEVLMVALGHLAEGPFVEGLQHDEEAEAVA
jgi:hypothetical protein